MLLQFEIIWKNTGQANRLRNDYIFETPSISPKILNSVNEIYS